MSASLAQDAIALLIELAQKGEIDPWDVRVIEVVDRYLSGLTLTPMPSPDSGASPYHADLSRSGQAFLYASMLVWLKADSLLRSESFFDDEEDFDGEEWLEDPVENGFSLPLRLERQLRRRAVAPPPRKRRVTLSEMIEQLEVMAATLAEPDRPPRTRRSRALSKAQAAGEIAELAHQENLTETAEKLDRFLTQNWSNFAIEDDEGLPFDRLLHLWSQACPITLSHASPTSHQVALFWALLLLSSQSKVELIQNEFYQDLTIRPIVEPERTLEAIDRSD
ncbi:MAG TPA: segregation/condensation protein A [Oscillatoriales cyanobacterium M59_W2019_021]|nr:MAG: segregation/condensation protein A [Cyanobacteria bacterium J055]HIK32654.1 segregation/condensation protein A [Oscillatoriales cyanobacterium M4454_W2019_049]HIK50677.1 segregation/condensation protein A [Oscillatoriales cyanobacterium M59_W2019_021]